MAGDVILKNVALVLLSMFFVAVIFSVPVSGYGGKADVAYHTMTPTVSVHGTVKPVATHSPGVMEATKTPKEDLEKRGKR